MELWFLSFSVAVWQSSWIWDWCMCCLWLLRTLQYLTWKLEMQDAGVEVSLCEPRRVGKALVQDPVVSDSLANWHATRHTNIWRAYSNHGKTNTHAHGISWVMIWQLLITSANASLFCGRLHWCECADCRNSIMDHVAIQQGDLVPNKHNQSWIFRKSLVLAEPLCASLLREGLQIPSLFA